MEQPPRFPAFRIVVLLVVLVNLILTIALVTQVRELAARFASLPPDVASKRDVAMLRPLRIREILTQNCVECHSSRRLGVTVAMEPAEIQRTPSSACKPPGRQYPARRVRAHHRFLLVVRCARCHGEETLNLMVLKTQPSASPPSVAWRRSPVRACDRSGARHRASVREADWRWRPRRGVQEN